MIRYIKADFYRVFTKISRYIVLGLLFILLGVILYAVAKNNATVYQLVDLLVKAIPYVAVAFGLVEYIYVYVEDFKAKTMQIAIGTGIPRRKVVLTKWVEFGLLCLLDYIVMIALIFIICAFNGLRFEGDSAKDVYILFLFGWLKAFVCVGFTMIVVFRTQATTGGLLLYLALSAGVVKVLLSTIFDLNFLAPLHLSTILFSNLLETARSRAVLGTFSTLHIIGILIYIGVCYLATTLLFRKKELEF